MIYRFIALLGLSLSGALLAGQTLPAPLQNALRTAAAAQQLPATATADFLIADRYTDAATGIEHVYLQQRSNGLPIYGAYAGLHLAPDGRALGTTLQFLPHPAARIAVTEVSLDARTALERATGREELQIHERPGGAHPRYTWLEAPAALRQAARTELLYYPVGKSLVAAYELMLDTPERGLEAVYVDARSGTVLHRRSLNVSCTHGDPGHATGAPAPTAPAVPAAAAALAPQYEVIALPLESPSYGTRTVVVDPATLNPTASPNGWHTTGAGSTTYTRGNNVDCYLDLDDSDAPTNGNADYADGGAALNFSFPYVPNTDPALYREAGVTAGFYGVNIIHDILYNYGFDPLGGNFEAAGGDAVLAEIQDGGSTCNANFATPPDGMQPRTQTYLCGNRDLAFDNGITFHEVGHGVSNRLTGGPSAATCLFNAEQMGEGWSDFLALILTMKAGDTPTTNRTIGNWLGGQPATGGGIRPTPYTTDMSVNGSTYGSVPGLSAPHGLGYVWCTMLWDLAWAFTSQYGFDADIYNGTGGNNQVLQLVMTGMKMQACSPGFVDGRDALLAADAALFGGANEALIWSTFARRGLGYSASQGSNLSRLDQIEAFDLPPAFGLATTVSTDKAQAAPGEQVTFTIALQNNSSQALSGIEVRCPLPDHTSFLGGTGASLVGGEVIFSGIGLGVGGSDTRTFTVGVDANAPSSPADLNDDFETGNLNWTSVSSRPGAFNWTVASGAGVGGSSALFGPEDENSLYLALEKNTTFGVGNATELRFRHELLSELHWDGGFVEITTDGGRTWIDLVNQFTQNGYNDYINNNPGSAAYSGSVAGFPEAVIDLSTYAGQAARLRFVMYSDAAVTVPGGGWTLDNIQLKNQILVLPMEVSLSSAQGVTARGFLDAPVVITQALPVVLTRFAGRHVDGRGNQLDWTTAVEKNSDRFVLEHRTPAAPFAPVATLRAAGDSETERTYTHTHRDVGPGLHYYRLRQLDLDGTETLSNTVVVQAAGEPPVTVSPNPTRGVVRLQLPPRADAGVSLELYDAQGRPVFRRAALPSGTHRIDLSHLPNGVYGVRIPQLGFTNRLLIAR